MILNRERLCARRVPWESHKKTNPQKSQEFTKQKQKVKNRENETIS